MYCTKTAFPCRQSLPSRERGLKYNVYLDDGDNVYVAPFAGAWIEMPSGTVYRVSLMMSLPSRERGLK